MTQAFWPFTDPLIPEIESKGRPIDQLARFSPDVGAPITRRRMTAQLYSWDIVIKLHDFSQFNLFEDWFEDDLAQGSLPFFWIHPRRKDLRRYKFAEGTYGATHLGGEVVRLELPLLMLPGANGDVPTIPWWQD